MSASKNQENSSSEIPEAPTTITMENLAFWKNQSIKNTPTLHNLNADCSFYINHLFDVGEVCQCCLSSGNFKNMFHKYEYRGNIEFYADMIDEAFSIQLPSDNPSEYHICLQCILKLRNAYNFKHQVLESQRKIKAQLLNAKKIPVEPFIIKEEPDTDLEQIYSDENDSDWSPEESLPLKEVKKVMIKPEIDPADPQITKSTNKEKNIIINKGAKIKKKMELTKVRRNRYSDGGVQSDRLENMKHNTILLLRNSNACLYRYKFNKLECYRCMTFFMDIEELREHSTKHDWEEIIKDINAYYTILLRKVEISELKCKICTKEVLDLKELRKHLIANHRVTFKGEEDLLVPYRIKDGEFKCVICLEKFQNYCKLNVHTNQHFPSFICELCGSGFICRKNLLSHTQKKHEKRRPCCKECKIEFKNEYFKEVHNTKVHKKAGLRVCLYCPERFTQHIPKILHMIKIHGHAVKLHKCQNCEKTFLTNSLLKSHVRIAHMKVKEYDCCVCSAKFSLKHHLNRHMERNCKNDLSKIDKNSENVEENVF